MNKLYLNIHQFKYTTYIMNICKYIYIYSVILSIFLFVYIECSFAF